MNRVTQARLIGSIAAALLISSACSRSADSTVAPEGTGTTAAGLQESTPNYPPVSLPASTAMMTVPAGTLVEVRLETNLNSGKSEAGDEFAATVTEDVIVGGHRAIPAGSTVYGKVAGVVPAKRGAGNARMTLAFDRLKMKGGSSTEIVAGLSQKSGSKKKRNAAIIGGSAAGGALLGRMIGKDTKGAVVGALAGGAVGTGVVMSKEGEQVKLPAGTEMTIKLDEAIRVPERS